MLYSQQQAWTPRDVAFDVHWLADGLTSTCAKLKSCGKPAKLVRERVCQTLRGRPVRQSSAFPKCWQIFLNSQATIYDF